jgi:hypothetical protein
VTASTLALAPDVMVAAAIASGTEVPDATDSARALAAAALAAADREVMADIVAHLAAAYTPSGRSGPRVSDFGSCRRSVWYREAPPDGFTPDPAQYDRQAALGTILHAAAATARAARYPWRWYEYELTIPGLDKPGRVDEYDPVLGVVSDLKTGGTRKWDRIGEDGPDGSVWGQVLIYGLALDAAGLPVRTVRIMVVNRDTGAEEHYVRDYDPAAARAALDELVELATALDFGVVPPRDGYGPSTDWQCRSCFARSHCWNVAAAAEAARSPESYTVLGADPDDESIVWAAEQFLAAKAARSAADEAYEVAKALIQGIEPATYGEIVIDTGRSTTVEYKDGFERVVALYGLSEANRPPVAEIAEPTKKTSRYTTARRVRAAQRGRKAKAPAAGEAA